MVLENYCIPNLVREFSSVWPKFTEGIVKMFTNLKQSPLKTFISGWHFVVEEIICNMEVYGQEPELENSVVQIPPWTLT